MITNISVVDTSNDVHVSVVYDVVSVFLGSILLLVSVSVLLAVAIVCHSIAATHALTLVILVSVACPSSIEPTHKAVEVEAVNHAIGSPVQLVNVQLDGVPNAGVVNEGLTNGANVSILSLIAFFEGAIVVTLSRVVAS